MSSSDSPFCVKKEFDNTLIKRMQSDIGEQNWNVLILLFAAQVLPIVLAEFYFLQLPI